MKLTGCLRTVRIRAMAAAAAAVLTVRSVVVVVVVVVVVTAAAAAANLGRFLAAGRWTKRPCLQDAKSPTWISVMAY